MRKYITLVENPIDDLTHVGDWTKGSSFRHAQDRKLLTNPRAIEKIHSQWLKVPVPFNIYLVNNTDGIAHGEVGMVSKEWVDTNLPKTAPFIDVKTNAVNLLFMNNRGAERVPMTGWVMAHRFGHAVSRYNIGGRQNQRHIRDFTDARDCLFRYTSQILNNVYGFGGKIPDTEFAMNRTRDYERLLVVFFEEIGTMRSARQNLIRTEFEFTLELLAQYMLTGKIKFNPLPDTLKRGTKFYARFNGSDYDKTYYNSTLEDLAEELEAHFANILWNCVGKILVM